VQFRRSVQDILQPHHDDHFLLRWLRGMVPFSSLPLSHNQLILFKVCSVISINAIILLRVYNAITCIARNIHPGINWCLLLAFACVFEAVFSEVIKLFWNRTTKITETWDYRLLAISRSECESCKVLQDILSMNDENVLNVCLNDIAYIKNFT